MTDFDGFAEEGYAGNSVIFSAIWFKARSIASIPVKAVTGDWNNPEPAPDNHPLSTLLRWPNRHQSWGEFMMQAHTYLNLDGNTFIIKLRGGPGGRPKALYCFRPDHMDILLGRDGVMGYRWQPYRGNEDDVVNLLPEDVMHIKYPNPLDPYEGHGFGLSPIMALAQSADVDNDITEFIKLFFQTGTVMMGVLETDAQLDASEISEIQERWKERYGGYEKWAEKIGVLARGMKYTRVAPTFSEMSFDMLDERNESRILACLGVPPILVGARTGLTHSTYNNYEQARLAAWEDTLLPEVSMYESEYEASLTIDGAWPMFDIYQVPAIQQRTLQRIQGFKILFDAGYPRDMAAEIAGVPAGESPNGDVSYMPLNLMPSGRLSAQPLPPAPPSDNPPEDEGEDEDISEDEEEQSDEEVEQAAAGPAAVAGDALPAYTSPWSVEQQRVLWKTADAVAASWEPQYRSAAANQFEIDRRNLLLLLNESKQAHVYEGFLSRADFYLMGRGQDGWETAMRGLSAGVLADALVEWEAVGVSPIGNASVLATAAMQEYPLQFATAVTDTTREGVRTVVLQALDEGWSTQRTANQLSYLFAAWATGETPDTGFFLERIPFYRSEIIARTESMRSYNISSFGIFTAAGAQAKQWLATMDDRVRTDHAWAHGQIVAINAPFNVGGYRMMYPGDWSAPLSEVCNCRCTTVPVF